MNKDEFRPTSALRSFDAFPKVTSTYSIRSTRGGLITIILGLCCVLITWISLAEYIGGIEQMQFYVDDSVQSQMQINFDVSVNMVCEGITVTATDAARDITLLSRLLTFEDIDFDLSDSRLINDAYKEDDLARVMKQAKKDKWKSRRNKGNSRKKQNKKDNKDTSQGCRIYGSFPITRVQGSIQIIAKGYGGWREDRVLGMEQLNFTHIIDELSFGEFYPKLVNPLDGVGTVTTDNVPIYQYFLSVVPTTYARVKSNGVIRHQVETNQYAVTEQKRSASTGFHPPGIFFRYDIEPLAVLVTKSRMPFTQFLVRLINIIGGIVVCTSWTYRAFDNLLNRRKNNQARSAGVLDVPSYEREEKN